MFFLMVKKIESYVARLKKKQRDEREQRKKDYTAR